MNNLKSFDGIRSRTVFIFWTGSESLSENRIRAIWSIFANIGCPVAFVTQSTLSNWILDSAPLHPAYPYLSSTHKSDYLRCYFMHHFGGGYTDIKHTSKNWQSYFRELEGSEYLVLGYQEIPNGAPHLKDVPGGDQIVTSDLIGLCSFIFKGGSEITARWYEGVNNILTQKLFLLQSYPAKGPLDQLGLPLPTGSRSNYPLRWAEILGEVLHPIVSCCKEKCIKAPIEPLFYGYR